MDETLQELENELKRLTPRRPSAGLMQALERELGPAAVPAAPSPARAALWRWPVWSLAAAAVLALVAVLSFMHRPVSANAPAPDELAVAPAGPTPSAPVASNRYEPIQASSVLYDLKEDGAALLPDQTEGRQLRYRYVDTYTWKNPTTNASLRWSVPRDEVRIIRASLD